MGPGSCEYEGNGSKEDGRIHGSQLDLQNEKSEQRAKDGERKEFVDENSWDSLGVRRKP